MCVCACTHVCILWVNFLKHYPKSQLLWSIVVLLYPFYRGENRGNFPGWLVKGCGINFFSKGISEITLEIVQASSPSLLLNSLEKMQSYDIIIQNAYRKENIKF